MAINSAYDLRFFESAENVRNVLARTMGRTPNTEVSKGIAVHIQQGRMFFESAANVPTEIRPLPLFYGMMAFAKAIIISRTYSTPAALPQAHGLSDTTAQNAILQDLTARIRENGTFQAFNDVMCLQGGISFYVDATSHRQSLLTASSADLNNMDLSLKEILSRIPSLEGYYENTFGEEANIHPFNLFSYAGARPRSEIRLDIQGSFDNFETLKTLVDGIRTKYPILNKWRFSEAQKAWGNSIVMFRSTAPKENEISQQHILFEENSNSARNTAPFGQEVDVRDLLDASCSTLDKNEQYLSVPLNGSSMSDASLQYVGMFLLGSLVRYRPQIWVHSVSRFSNQDRAADDHALGLIEQFMLKVQHSFPSLVVKLLTER